MEPVRKIRIVEIFVTFHAFIILVSRIQHVRDALSALIYSK